MSGLLGSTVLEIVIGLSFTYFVLSLICSHVNELLAGFMKLRAQDLERGIRNMLCDPDLAMAVLNHPRIKAMGSTRSETIAVEVAAGGAVKQTSNFVSRALRALSGARYDFAGKPSYIPSSTFSAAFLDTLSPGSLSDQTSLPAIRERALRLTNGQVADFDTRAASGAPQVAEDFVQKVKGNQPGLAPGQRDPRLAAIGVNDMRAVVGALLPSTKQLDKAMASARTLDDIRQVVMKYGTTDRKAIVLQFMDAVQAEKGKQTIGRSLLSLIDESRQPQTLVQALTNANAVIDGLQDASEQDAARQSIAGANTTEDLRKAILLVPDAGLRARLLQTVQTGEANLETLRANIETWYDQTMDRVRGIYKRRTQWWLLVISTAIVAMIGADSLQMYNSLAGNPAVRAAVVAEAGKSGSASTRSLPQIINQLNGTTLPVGYGGGPNPTRGVTWWKWLVEKLLGLLITIFAVSLGAPFWFDVLRKVSNIRAAGPPPDRQPASQPPASAS